MRVNKLARIIVGIASIFVAAVTVEGSLLVLGVRPTWRRPRCSCCGGVAPGYDQKPLRRWVHLGPGSLRIILEYAPRRVECPRCGVRVELVPWARPDSRFSRPFEEMTAFLAQTTDKTAVARLLGISWATVGNIIERVVPEKLDPARLEELRRIGVDEFGYLNRQRYITIVVDHDKGRVVWAAKGKGADTLDAFFAEVGEKRAAKLEVVTLDMAAGYIKSIKAKAPNAETVFDRFHVQKLASDAVDEVRRVQVSRCRAADPDAAAALKRSRYALLKNPWDLSAKQWDKLAAIQRHNAPLYRAYLLKEALADVFREATVATAATELGRWIAWAARSRLQPFVRVAKTVRRHRRGILAYFRTRLTNGLAEGINNKLRVIARRAFGFHGAEALIAMLFLCCGGVTLAPPLPGPWCTW